MEGAVGIVSLGLTVLQGLWQYYCSWKDCPEDVKRTMSSIQTLTDILRRIEALTKDPNLDPSFVEPLGKSIQGCKMHVEKLEKKLDKINQQGPKIKTQFRRTMYPFRESTLAKFRETISEFQDHIALTVNTSVLDISIKSRQEQQKVIDGVDAIGVSLNRIQDDQRLREIHRWLGPADPSSNHNAACEKRQPKSGGWLIGGKPFSTWRTSPGSFIWLHGIPGCGKTILCSTVIEEVIQHHQPGFAVAYFYFVFNDPNKQTPDQLIRSLIAQLSTQSVASPEPLSRLYSDYRDGEQQPTMARLLQTLKDIIYGFTQTYLIFDALDECSKREDLSKFFREVKQWGIESLHILVTSRKETDIEDCIGGLVKIENRICLQTALVNDDIRAYVQDKLQTGKELERWRNNEKVQTEIEQSLMDKACGMFRWAVCQIDALAKRRNLPTLRKALKSLPPTLDETYARILGNIPEEDSENTLKVLQWLVFSERPMRVEELAEIFTVDTQNEPVFDLEGRFPEPREVISLCSSLVITETLPYNVDGRRSKNRKMEIVRLAHFSVKEYLVSEQIKRSEQALQYSIQKLPANVSIAKTCLAYILHFDSPGLLIDQTVENFPLAEYSARYWSDHARNVDRETDTLHALINRLLQVEREACCNWILLRNNSEPSRLRGYSIQKAFETFPSPLYYSSLIGLVEYVKAVIHAGADVNAQGGEYGTALHAASMHGYDQIVKQLLDAGADVNSRKEYALQPAPLRRYDQTGKQMLGTGADVNARKGSALQIASIKGYDQIVKQMIEAVADVNAQGESTLRVASIKGYDQIFKQLLEAEADVNAQESALNVASELDYGQIVKQLLEAGADVDAQEGLETALQTASRWGHDQTVKQLLEAGADVNAQEEEYGTALQAASRNGHDQIVKRLLEAGADVNAQEGKYGTALQAASRKGHDHIVKQLLEAGADVNAQKEYALQPASAKDYDQILTQLLEAEADVNAQGRYGNTPQVASMKGHGQIAKQLLEAEADVNAQEGTYGTALHVASRCGNDQIVKQLLEAGADVNASGKYGTALYAASFWGHDKIVKQLLEAKADVNASGKYGTALHAASFWGYDQVVKELIETGADVNAQEGDYETALHAASFWGYDQIVKQLIEAGADFKEGSVLQSTSELDHEQIIKRLSG